MDKFQIPGKSYSGLTENERFPYYELSLLRNYGHFLGTKVTILWTLDKADMLYYSYNIVM